MKSNLSYNSVKKLVILGSTGSVGSIAVEAAVGLPEYVRITGISTDKNLRGLKNQIIRCKPKWVCVSDLTAARRMRETGTSSARFKLFSGEPGISELAALPEVDAVFNAIVGLAGLKPTIAALESGHDVLTANKESIVAGGELIRKTALLHGASLIPVDSEHSAIFQCVQGRLKSEIKKVILTASGGPFLGRKNLNGVTPEQALAHPRWRMGRKVSIDSATLMNKGLELIEASRLFSLRPEQLTLVIHPESVVHSLVEFIDGSMLAQLATPDMKVPVTYALTYPDRAAAPGVSPLNLSTLGSLTFMEPDERRYPCLGLAREALCRGGIAPAALSAADEYAVGAFLKRKIKFTDIPSIIESTLKKLEMSLDAAPETVEIIMEVDTAAKRIAAEYVKKRRV